MFPLSSSDVAPLSAPAFSFCFPLLNAKLRQSSGSTEETESMMTRALQVVMEHCKLRASGMAYLDFAVDEVNANFFAVVGYFAFRRTSAVHVGGAKLQRTVTLSCSRLAQSCSHGSTCFCFWKGLFLRQRRDSRYYRTSRHRRCVWVKLMLLR